MIHLTRLNRSPLVVNSDLIEYIDVTPDTLIVLTTGQKILVLESAAEVVEMVIGFRRRLLEQTSLCARCTQCAGTPLVQTRTSGPADFAPAETSLT